MKLWAIFRFELVYQIRRAWPWLIFAVIAALSFLMARDTSVADAMFEEFHVNSPFAIAKTTVLGTLVWLVLASGVAGEAAARDVATGMHPLTFTSPVSKFEYLAGRFLAALVINAVLLLAVQIGILLGIYWPGANADFIGPFRPAAFLTAYAFISLPNAIIAAALQFLVAGRTGRAMASYASSVFLVFLGFFIATYLNLFVRPGLGTLFDPIGLHFVIDDLAHDWTTIERNTRMLALEGVVLRNRALWLAVAMLVLAFTYLRFRFAHRTATTWWWRRNKPAANEPSDISAAPDERRSARDQSVLDAQRRFDVPTQARVTLGIAWASFRAIATSWTGLAMLIGLPILSVIIVMDQMTAVGTPLVPITSRVTAELVGPLSAELSRWVIVPLLIAFFAGELLWREREAGLGEIADAMPGSEWSPFLGKLLGLAFVLIVFMAGLMAAGIAAQTILGYHHYDIGLSLEILFGLQLPEYLLFAVLALAVHVAANQKYVGHMLAIMVYVYIAAVAGLLGVEHNMLVYGAGPGWSYTQMRGFGPSLGPWLWFKLYWAAWALLLSVAAVLLWVRGRETSFGARVKVGRRRLAGSTAAIAGIAVVFIALTGGFVFYNTNIINTYRSTPALNRLRAEYERRYGRYENVVQPHVSAANLRVEIHATQRGVEISGTYHLVNRGAAPIDSIHLTTATGASVHTSPATFDRPAALVADDPELGYRIYALERPLEPGDSLNLKFEVRVAPRGFTNRGVDRSITAGGTYFSNAAWFPAIGYQASRALVAPSERREQGLAPRPLLASLFGEGNDAGLRGEGTMFQAVVGTDGNQVAVAPGALRRTWTENGRHYFDYATDAPIGSEWSFFSAHYAVHEEMQDGVAIRIYHHPSHTAHVDGMMRSARASLDYYSKQFGPYPYHHLTFVEQAGAPATGAHADASMISYGEGWAGWIPPTESRGLDMPYAVIAHEMGHQWTLPYALVEGLPFLSEGLAWYFGMQLVKESRGDEQFRRLLSFMRGPYPYTPIRHGEPLLRALDPYLSYRKGPFAMYALSQYGGVDRVNGAIRHLIASHDSAGAPLVTTLDLYRALQSAMPDSVRPLLHDLFEVNAFWQFGVRSATAVETAPGTWQVTLRVRARKAMYDSAGVETELPVNEWIPVGVFAAAERGHDRLSAPLYLQMHRLHAGEQTLTITVRGRPALAGADPNHLLDWEEGEEDDNVER